MFKLKPRPRKGHYCRRHDGMDGEYDDPDELWTEAWRVMVSHMHGDGSMPEKPSVEARA